MKSWLLCRYLFHMLPCGCVTKLPGETLHIQLLTFEREPKTDQSMDTNKIQLGKPVDFTEAEMTQTVIPPKPTPTWWQLIKAGSLEPTAQPAGGSTGGRVSFLNDSVGLNLFQAGGLVWVFFAACLVWEQFSSVFTAYMGREGPSESESCQFWGLPKAILFTFLFKELPCMIS